ncbi:MAG: prepilin peptidase [Alphaproteobacteria bacterium]|nr:prepilin peptidase [Alphaproteobacteria bacterium]MDP7222439.1 prepilin peptidase [Alphaproteobacteria bacterium]
MSILTQLDFWIVLLSGVCFGSFASALVWRVPRGISWIFPSKSDRHTDAGQETVRSRCPSCGHILSVRDLVPVLSWVFLRGKCRFCKKTISFIYPLMELLSFAAVVALYVVYGLSPLFVVTVLTVPFLVALLFIDIRYYILPNQLVLVLALLGIGYHGLLWWFDPQVNTGVLLYYGISGAVYGLISWATGFLMSLVLRKQSLGFGDVKFFAVAGLWLGLNYLPYFMIVSGVIGILWALPAVLKGKKGRFPFGPALILSFFFGILLKGVGFVPFLSGFS